MASPPPRRPLHTARLLLRPYELADAPAFGALLLAEAGRLGVSFPDRVRAVPTLAAARTAVQGFLDDWRTGRFYVLGIWHQQTQAYLGDICLLPRPPLSGEIGYYLAAAAEGQGYAREALAAMVAFGFRQLDLPLLTVRCFASNERAQAVARATGFQPEQTASALTRLWELAAPGSIRRFVRWR